MLLPVICSETKLQTEKVRPSNMELIVYTLCDIGFLIIIGLSHFVRSYRKRSSINIPRENRGEDIGMRPVSDEHSYIAIYDEVDEDLKKRTSGTLHYDDDTSSYLEPCFTAEETDNKSSSKESSSNHSSNLDLIISDHTGYLNPYQPLRERQLISDGYEVTVLVHKNSDSSTGSESSEEMSSSYKYSHVYQQLQKDQSTQNHEYEKATKTSNEMNINLSKKNEIQDCRNKVSKDIESIDLLNRKEADEIYNENGQLNAHLFFGQTIGDAYRGVSEKSLNEVNDETDYTDKSLNTDTSQRSYVGESDEHNAHVQRVDILTDYLDMNNPIIGTVTAYDLKCPAKAEWRFRANVSCYSETKYVCLFHLLQVKYEENCLGSDQSSIGSQLVFQPLFNLAECNTDRYQPIVFTTYGNSECILIKSKCAGEGQVVYSDESPSKDITCRCDYTRGYVHVSKPQNSCFCIPSEEDCSCFRVNCTKLSPDYQCITDQERMVNTKCWGINRYTFNNTQSSIVLFIEKAKIVQQLTNKCNDSTITIVLSKETIETEGRIILKCYLRSYLPLTSVIWYTGPGENIFTDTRSNNICSSNGMRTLTFESPVDNDITTYTCRASNLIGAVESNHVHLNEHLSRHSESDEISLQTNGNTTRDEERQQFIHELFLKGECGKLHFARLVFIGKNGVGKTSLMRRLLWQNKEDVTSTQSTDGIEVEKCNINIKDGKWSKWDSK
ncbi:unnamed protein product [Mytilus edulis]|uniref:Ig-like domain-containing protein n=1 Tax=Mytilus edulis TaxID=6550 RepID=A0A8S3R9A6_MYTED|nr:unnamed protein product [Mytilus edulis]